MRAMTSPAEWRIEIARLPPGTTAKFRIQCGGRRVSGFVVNHDGTVHAYENYCPHVGTPLDLWENEFLAEDLRTIVCATSRSVSRRGSRSRRPARGIDSKSSSRSER